MTEIGSHLLGRKPSPPDLRDYRLANFTGIGSQNLAQSDQDLALYAMGELRQTTITYKNWASRHYNDVTVTHWWKALNALAQIANVPPPPPSTDVVWGTDFQLDQGAGVPDEETGHCVGFGWAGWGNTLPVDDNWVNADGHAIYYECKVIEGDPGGEDGAYTRDGAKAMLNRERLSAYAFADTMDDILTYLRTKGPVVVGTDWTDDMFDPDSDGFVVPTGSVAGGHCYLLYGVEGSTLIFKNSWGDSWGDEGSFRMYRTDFQTLLDAYGEAVASVELPL